MSDPWVVKCAFGHRCGAAEKIIVEQADRLAELEAENARLAGKLAAVEAYAAQCVETMRRMPEWKDRPFAVAVELRAERALADQLAEAIRVYLPYNAAVKILAAWEARRD